MLDIPALDPITTLFETTQGDEGADGGPVHEPVDFEAACSFALIDKSARFVANLPHGVTPASLAQGYVCRPYRSDVQRLRAIFTWVAERVSWEEDFEFAEGDVDSRRTIQTLRGCSEEISVLVMEMCGSVGMHCEVVRGYLKTPGQELHDVVAELEPRPNHWWNAVIVDGEWRIIDCALASPSHPKRSLLSAAGQAQAESHFFLMRPSEACFTHIPQLPEQQHIVPPVTNEVLTALPCACPPYFRSGLQLIDFDTALLNLENLEMAQLKVEVAEDLECVAEVEVRGFIHDADGDVFEGGDVVRKPALAQAEWLGGRKHYIIKAVLPGDEGRGLLKVYAGKKGLMVSPHTPSFRKQRNTARN